MSIYWTVEKLEVLDNLVFYMVYPLVNQKDIKYLLICATSGSHEDHRVHRESIQIEVIDIACKHNTRLATTKPFLASLDSI